MRAFRSALRLAVASHMSRRSAARDVHDAMKPVSSASSWDMPMCSARRAFDTRYGAPLRFRHRIVAMSSDCGKGCENRALSCIVRRCACSIGMTLNRLFMNAHTISLR